MKLYQKNEEIKAANRIVVVKDDMKIINPSEEDILADGWVEYTPPIPNEDEIFKVETKNKVMELVYNTSATSMINMFSLSNKEALAVKELYPVWSADSIDVKKGEKYQCDDLLWEVIQDHTTQELWKPSLETASLWKVVEVEHEGTQEDPIPYNNNMELFEGKYYSQDGVTYLCTRSTGQAVYNNLSELVGIYVEVA